MQHPNPEESKPVPKKVFKTESKKEDPAISLAKFVKKPSPPSPPAKVTPIKEAKTPARKVK